MQKVKAACLGEVNENKLSIPTLECIDFISNLNFVLNKELILINSESKCEKKFSDLYIKNIDLIKCIEGESLAKYNPEIYSDAFSKILKNELPELIAIPYTIHGMEIGPLTAFKLGLPLITYVKKISINDYGNWKVARAIFKGKIIENKTISSKNIMISLRPGDFLPSEIIQGKSIIKAFKYETSILNRDIVLLERKKEEMADIDISQYKIIVAVGRGINRIEEIKMAEELANTLGGTLACSKPIVDYGLLPKSRQVGLTGKTVSPNLYLALGISGDLNHIVGMKNSKIIISVNKDPSAPIINISDYAIIEDLNIFLPILLKALKNK